MHACPQLELLTEVYSESVSEWLKFSLWMCGRIVLKKWGHTMLENVLAHKSEIDTQ